MAGSLKWIPYDTDDGLTWALFRDESNFENVNTDGLDITLVDLTARRYAVPRNVTPRFAYFKSTSSPRVRKVIVPTTAHAADLLAAGNTITVRTFSDADTNETFQFSSLIPESVKPVVIDADTGINDGDAT